MAGAVDERRRLEEEKLQLVMQRDKLEEARKQLDKSNLAEDERIGKEIKEIHAKIEALNQKLKVTALRVE
jgi:hypothetical protein